MSKKENIEEIAKILPLDVCFQQIAEECCELSQAALKFSRYCGDINIPYHNGSPATLTYLETEFLSEVADVLLVLDVLDEKVSFRNLNPFIEDQKTYKADRWIKRLTEKGDNNE